MERWYNVLLPSRYGIFIMIVFAIALTVLFALPSILQESGIAGYLSLVKEGEVELAVYSDYEQVSERINTSKFAADSSVFIFWSVVGLLLYAGVLALLHVIDETRKFANELENAKQSRREIAVSAAEKLLVRLIAITALYGWMLFMRAILPWILATASGIFTSGLASGVWQGFLVLVSLIVSIHIGVVSLRLLFLRTRLLVGSTTLRGGHD